MNKIAVEITVETLVINTQLIYLDENEISEIEGLNQIDENLAKSKILDYFDENKGDVEESVFVTEYHLVDDKT